MAAFAVVVSTRQEADRATRQARLPAESFSARLQSPLSAQRQGKAARVGGCVPRRGQAARADCLVARRAPARSGAAHLAAGPRADRGWLCRGGTRQRARRHRPDRVAEPDLCGAGRRRHRRRRRHARWLRRNPARWRRDSGGGRGGDLPARNGVAGGALERARGREGQMACGAHGWIRSGAGVGHRLSFHRAFRSAEQRDRAGAFAGRARWAAHRDAALQAVPRGENVVRAFLAASAARILAARAGRAAVARAAKGDSLHVDHGSDADSALTRSYRDWKFNHGPSLANSARSSAS